MGLGDNVSKNFEKLALITPKKYYEEELFTKLEDAIIFSNNQNIHSGIMHGSRSIITYKRNKKNFPKCELGDMVFLITDSKNKKARICLFQFKRDLSTANTFKGSYNQLYLYQNRCSFVKGRHKAILPTMITNNILKCAKASSFTAYGIFFQDKAKNSWNMKYSDAHHLKIVKIYKDGEAKIKRVIPSTNYSKIPNSRNFEAHTSSNLIDLFNKMEKMEIGEPVNYYSVAKAICYSTYNFGKALNNKTKKSVENIVNEYIGNEYIGKLLETREDSDTNLKNMKDFLEKSHRICLLETNTSNVDELLLDKLKMIHKGWDDVLN
jgi:hypothetical protein